MSSTSENITESPKTLKQCKVCKKEADLKCSQCLIAVYCSEEHQQEHWAKHRDVCYAFEVQTSPKYGRHLVAARNIAKGAKIVREAPLAMGPALLGALPWSCPGCYRGIYPQSADKCPNCQWPVCSKRCAGLTKPDLHGSECKLLKMIKQVTKTSRMDLLLPLRCLFLQTTKPKKWRLLQEIACEASVRKRNCEPDPNITTLEKDLIGIIKAAPHVIRGCSETDIKSVVALLTTKTRGLFTPYSGPLAAVYNYCSLLAHSCVPNVTMTYEVPADTDTVDPAHNNWRGRINVQTLRDISKGEVLTFPWANLFRSTFDRLKELRSLHDFRCSCARCMDPTELGTHSGTLKCLDCPGYLLPVNPARIENCDWLCDQGCGKKMTSLEVQALQHCLFLELGRTRYEGEVTIEKLDALLSSLQKYLHPCHFINIMVKHLLSKTYGEGGKELYSLSTEQLIRKSELSKEVWMTMCSPFISHHGATNAAECLIEHFRADFELLKRKFTAELWDSERAVKEVLECRALLARVPEVCRTQAFYPPRAKLVNDAVQLDIAIVYWANIKGLKLPEDKFLFSSV